MFELGLIVSRFSHWAASRFESTPISSRLPELGFPRRMSKSVQFVPFKGSKYVAELALLTETSLCLSETLCCLSLFVLLDSSSKKMLTVDMKNATDIADDTTENILDDDKRTIARCRDEVRTF